jgi:putative phosphotransacetylase
MTSEKTIEELIKVAVMQEIAAISSKSKVQATTQTEKISRDIPVGISARHLHVTQEHLEILFGKGATLTFKKELMGGQFAANERVTIVGINLRVIENVRILGPTRNVTQVEVSKTDARQLGLSAPIRPSGNIAHSSSITIVGPKGAIYLAEGCIVAQRHIHMNEEDARRLNVKDKDVLAVKVGSEARKGILNHVLIRVDPSYTLEMHIDTDEANALGINPKDTVELVS